MLEMVTVPVTGSVRGGTEGTDLAVVICSELAPWGLGSGTIVLQEKKNPKPQQPDNSTGPPRIVLFLCVFSNCKTSNRDRSFTGFICLRCLTADLI